MADESFTSEVILVDKTSDAANRIADSLSKIRDAGESLLTVEEKRERAASAALRRFEALEKRQNALARAEQRHAGQLRDIERAQNQTAVSADRLARATKLANEAFDDTRRRLDGNITAYRRAGQAGDRFDNQTGGLARGIGRVNVALNAGIALVTAFTGALVVRKLAEFNDILQQSENRIRIVTDSYGELLVSQEAVFASSQESFTAILGGVEIYERLARSTKNLEISNSRLLVVTEAIQKSVSLSGTTALAANAAMIQFGQGLAADSLRGQELNSVMEQTPRLARALAEGLGVSIGELRALANQGELTAEKVIKAIESQVDVINSEFATIEPTLAQVTTAFENSATVIGAAFGEPIFDAFKDALNDLNDVLDDPETIEKARNLGQTLGALFNISRGAFEFVGDGIGGIFTAISEFDAKTAEALQRQAEQAQDTPIDKLVARLSKGFLEGVPILGAYYTELARIREEYAAVAKNVEAAKKEFEDQESLENLGALFGLTGSAAADAGVELGLFADAAAELDAEKAEKFAEAVFNIGQGFVDAENGLEPLADDLDRVVEQFIALSSLGPDAIARLNAAAANTKQFDSFVDDLEARLGELLEKKQEEKFGTKSGILEIFDQGFPGASPEQRAEVEKLASEIENLSAKTKEASDNFLELALRARELADLQNFAAAAAFGPERLKEAQDEAELQKELLKLEADARKENERFDRAAEEARLRAIQDQEKQIESALEAFEEMQRLRAIVIDDVNNDIRRVTGSAGNDRRFSSASDTQREQALFDALSALNRRRKEFDDVDSIGLTEDQIDEMNLVFDEAAREMRRIFVEDGPAEFEARLRSATEYLAKTLLEDIFLNGGKGLGQIFQGLSEDTFSRAIIDPLSKFLSGDSDDLFGDIGAALEESAKKFERAGGQIGKLFDNEEFGKTIGKEVGEAFNNFAIGNTVAGLFGDSKAGKAGAAAGAAIGQIAELATGIPFLGEAIGALGGLIGGLFGRKTATGTFDFSTGNIELEASKKDARNQERDVVLEQAIQAVQALASALGGSLRVGTGLEVNVDKRSITTDIIDPRTGQVIQSGGSVGRGDVAGAVSNILNAALDAVIQGGDERLTEIAKAFAAADLPAEKLVNSISNLSQVFDFIEGPASQFSQVLDEVVKIFGEATSAAGQFASATREVLEAQLDTLQSLGGKFDEDTEAATRRLVNPLLQDALDLSEDQLKRLEDAKRLNDEILRAVQALNAAPAAGPGNIGGFGGFNFPDTDGFAAIRRFFQQQNLPQTGSTPTAAQNSAILDAQAEAQARLNAVIELSTEEFKAFIRNADGSPESFRAVAQAIEELRTQALALGIDFQVLTDELEDVRLGLAEEFDDSEADRRQRLENPLAAQAEGIVDAQIKIIDAARAIGGSQEELQARLARVYSTNALELEKFIESAASSPDAIAEVVAALDSLRERAQEVGVTLQEIDQIGAGAIIGAGDAFLETINKDFLKFTNDPLSRLVSLLEAEEKLVETAKKFAELNPARFGGLPAIVQNRNALEREKFLESLSDEEKLRLGDFIGLIEDYGGRIAVVSTQLRDTLKKNTDDVEEEIDRLNDVFETSNDRARQLADARQAIEDRFFPGTPGEQFRSTEARLEDTFQRALSGDEDALDSLPQLATQFVDQAANVFGANEDFVDARNRAFEILEAVEAAEREKAEEAQSQIDILEADLEVSKNILKSLESAQDNTLYLQQIVDNGLLQNQLLSDQIEELLRLRALQAGQNVNVVSNLGALDSSSAILSAFQNSAPNFSGVDQSALTTLVQSAVAGSVPNFSFAKTSFDVASQIADLMAIARQSQPELSNGNVPTQASQTVVSTQPLGQSSSNNAEVVLAIGALEQTMATAFSRLINEIVALKDEIRILRLDNQRLNNELKASYRLTTTQAAQ